MMKLKVKRMSLPERCEICHQTDWFDAEKNYCSRCSVVLQSISSEAHHNVTPQTEQNAWRVFSLSWLATFNNNSNIRNIGIGIFTVVIISIISYSLASGGIFSPNSSTKTSKTITLNKEIIVYQKPLEDAGFYMKEGIKFEKQSRIEEAINSYKHAIELNPRYTTAHINLGVLYENQGNYQEAITEFNLVIEQNRYYKDAYIRLANIYRILGKKDKAEETIKSIPKELGKSI